MLPSFIFHLHHQCFRLGRIDWRFTILPDPSCEFGDSGVIRDSGQSRRETTWCSEYLLSRESWEIQVDTAEETEQHQCSGALRMKLLLD